MLDGIKYGVPGIKYHANKLAEAGLRELLYLYNRRKIEIDEITDKKNKILMLAKSNSIFPKIINKLETAEGVKIIYSMWEGYLTEEFKEFCNNKEIDIEHVHTSGHAILSDLKRLAKALKPRLLIPIHTFEPKQYKKYFENVKIANDGQNYSI
jgi:ribonuclease J